MSGLGTSETAIEAMRSSVNNMVREFNEIHKTVMLGLALVGILAWTGGVIGAVESVAISAFSGVSILATN